ncbi:chromate transporter [Massilia sp. 9I]|uniref:chromate transporter n=1 Tax=Massilia sp. 9I TaxID=2653152 RepID=UPI0012F2C53B|nr:chromate transporter [Massilia sp. 9I]VXB91063.1 ChrA half sized-like protein [Massilia sp. 9I]
MTAPVLVLGWQDWLSLLAHYLVLSLLQFGGAISVTADMHRFLVDDKGWLSQSQFSDAIALAQAAPGPNVLFVALMGWHLGMNSGSLAAAFAGVAVTMLGILLPSSILNYQVAQWGHRNRDLRAVRAFRLGMAPIVVGMLLATSWLLASSSAGARAWPLWLLAALSCLVIWRTRLHLLWMLGAGALLGALGFV